MTVHELNQPLPKDYGASTLIPSILHPPHLHLAPVEKDPPVLPRKPVEQPRGDATNFAIPGTPIPGTQY